MAFSFVVSEVVRPLRIDMQHAVTLSFKIQRRAPAKLSAAAKQELAALKESTEKLDAELANELNAEAAPADARPLAWAAKIAWGSFFARLDSVARLEDATIPEVLQAKEVMQGIFPSGLNFVSGDHETLWLRGQHTLGAIARLGHTDAVEALAGDFMLRAVRARHHALGVALGLAGSIRPVGEESAAPAVDRRALLDAITASIARYAQHVTAIDVTDAAAVKVAERALEPLVKFRAKAKASRATTDDGSDDEDTSGKNDAPAQPVTVTRGGASNDTVDAKRNVA